MLPLMRFTCALQSLCKAEAEITFVADSCCAVYVHVVYKLLDSKLCYGYQTKCCCHTVISTSGMTDA